MAFLIYKDLMNLVHLFYFKNMSMQSFIKNYQVTFLLFTCHETCWWFNVSMPIANVTRVDEYHLSWAFLSKMRITIMMTMGLWGRGKNMNVWKCNAIGKSFQIYSKTAFWSSNSSWYNIVTDRFFCLIIKQTLWAYHKSKLQTTQCLKQCETK